MLNKKVYKALNEQFEKEFFSSNLYLSMAAYFNRNNFNGFANWMRIQAQEEMDHAMLIFDYVHQRGGVLEIPKIEKPQHEWASALEAFEAAYEHELFITKSIHNLLTLANEEKDYATANFLQWFIKEQVEEEDNTSELVERLKLCEENNPCLFMLDSKLLGRQHTPITIDQI